MTDRAAEGWRRFGPPVVLVAILLVAWEIYSRASGIEPVRAAVADAASPARYGSRPGELALPHCIPTIVETVAGLAVSIICRRSSPRSPWIGSVVVRRAVEPLLVASQTIPIVAIAPLIVVWFGFGLAPKILVVVLVTFFPITVALLDGFSSAASATRQT